MGEGRVSGRQEAPVPLAGDARFHAQVGLEFLFRESQKQVTIYLLLLGAGSKVRKEEGKGPLLSSGPQAQYARGGTR